MANVWSNPLYFANTAFIRFSSNKQREKTTNKRERERLHHDNIETENTVNINIAVQLISVSFKDKK